MDHLIADAIGRRLHEANLGYPIFWENQEIPAGQAKPFLVFEYVPVSRRDISLTGGAPRISGFVQFTVISEKGQFATNGRRIAEQVAAVFDRADPAKATVQAGALKIKFGDTMVMQPYPDDAHWRTPVQVRFTAL